MFAIWHIQSLCCNGGTQLCGPWQNYFPSSTDTDAKSSVPTHQVAVCLRSKYMKESLDLQNVLSISISQLTLLLLHFMTSGFCMGNGARVGSVLRSLPWSNNWCCWSNSSYFVVLPKQEYKWKTGGRKPSCYLKTFLSYSNTWTWVFFLKLETWVFSLKQYCHINWKCLVIHIESWGVGNPVETHHSRPKWSSTLDKESFATSSNESVWGKHSAATDSSFVHSYDNKTTIKQKGRST